MARWSQWLCHVTRSRINITKGSNKSLSKLVVYPSSKASGFNQVGDTARVLIAMDPDFLVTDLQDPHYGGPLPRWGPRQRAHTWRHDKKRQVVWPRDKKQKGAHSWSRWKDVLTGKGPDMWIARRDSYGPHRPVWSGWQSPRWPGRIWDNLGYRYRRDNELEPLPWAKRPGWEKYDFKARKYQRPQPGTWSDVKWNKNARYALYWQNRYGDQFVNPDVDHGLFNAGVTRNPFEYDPFSPYWDWHYDRS